jgi:2-dehydro-3-deoxyphosphooctonate aldolase (KDO 8-P synthase)
MREVEIGQGVVIGGGRPFVLVAGPCVIESEDLTLRVAGRLKEIARSLDVPLVFKASYDKANRTSRQSFRGPGLEKGLEILDRVKREFALPVLSDVHRFEEIRAASEVLDVVQVPAFLCRQTDFLQEVARSARVVNIKKGQFVAPWDGGMILDKAAARGMRTSSSRSGAIPSGTTTWWRTCAPSPFSGKRAIPSSSTRPTASSSPGERERRRAETGKWRCSSPGPPSPPAWTDVFRGSPRPGQALCDGPNSLELERVPELLRLLRKIDDIVKEEDGKWPGNRKKG